MLVEEIEGVRGDGEGELVVHAESRDVVLDVFFFKQKTAYEIMPSLVGSEMWYKRQKISFLRHYYLGQKQILSPR